VWVQAYLSTYNDASPNGCRQSKSRDTQSEGNPPSSSDVGSQVRSDSRRRSHQHKEGYSSTQRQYDENRVAGLGLTGP
jgi:hypothetical protein